MWYVIPLGAVLSGDPFLSTVGYALYGFTRTACVGAVVAIEFRHPSAGQTILDGVAIARRMTSLQLLIIGVAALASFGF